MLQQITHSASTSECFLLDHFCTIAFLSSVGIPVVPISVYNSAIIVHSSFFIDIFLYQCYFLLIL